MNSRFLMKYSLVLLALKVMSVFCASTLDTVESGKENLVQSGNLLDSTSAIGSNNTTEYGNMMQFLDDNYQFAHAGVQEYLGIETDHGDKMAERLQRACFFGNIQAIEELIKAKVDIRMHNDMAIKTAADMNHNHIVKGLYKYGCNSENVIKYILITGAKNGNLDLVQFALGTVECTPTPDFNDIAMAEAVRYGHLDVVKSIFQSGISAKDSRKYYISLAKIKGFTDISLYFADTMFNIENFENDDILYWASKFGHIEIVEFLLRNGADIHAYNEAALREACDHSHCKIVELLIKNGADIANCTGTPLVQASLYGRTGVVEILLKYNEHSQDDYDTALQRASEFGHSEIVELLLKDNNANVHTYNDLPLRKAVQFGHTSVVKLLLDYEADVSKADGYSFRRACSKGYTDIVRLLIGKNGNVPAKDDEALRLAKEFGHTEIVELLENGANLNGTG